MPVNLDSLLARLAAVPDPRRPQGRRYPLASLLGLVVLGTVHGETSLRGIWVWARYHWPHIWHTLGFPSACFPALSTIWSVLAQVDRSALEQITAAWTEQVFPQLEGGFSADGKVLRGSRRDDTVGVQLVALVQHQHAVVLQQRPVTDGNGELGALWHLLQETDLAQRVVTLDAGLLQSSTTRAITRRGGDYLGVVKRNFREVKTAIDEWLEACGITGDIATRGAAAATTSEKNRGRLEERALWVCEAAALAPYLCHKFAHRASVTDTAPPVAPRPLGHRKQGPSCARRELP